MNVDNISIYRIQLLGNVTQNKVKQMVPENAHSYVNSKYFK